MPDANVITLYICRVFVGNPESRRALGRPRCRWEDILRNLQIGWEGVYWVDLNQCRDQLQAVVNVGMNNQVFIRCEEIS